MAAMKGSPRCRLELTMYRIVNGILYVVIALAVAYPCMQFGAPHYGLHLIRP